MRTDLNSCRGSRPRRRHGAWAAALLSLLCALAPGAAQAQAVTQYQEDGQLIRGRQGPGQALGPDLFGDKLSLYTGAVEFVQQDVSLPGNSALPVAVGRRMPTGARRINSWHFADWDLDLPHLRGVFPQATGWRVYGTSAAAQGQRCTRFMDELQTVRLPSGQLYEPGFPLVHLHLPGGESQELLARNPAYTATPGGGMAHPVLTKAGWQFSCLPSLAGGSNTVGEGFLARAPDGTSYRFDWVAHRAVPEINIGSSQAFRAASTTGSRPVTGSRVAAGTPGGGSQPNAALEDGIVQRVEVWLMPTVASDRFGNTVRYTYSAQRPWQLLRIEASDQRTLTLEYNDAAGGNFVTAVSDGQRRWRYDYSSQTYPTQLSRVTLPDNAAWSYSGDSLQTIYTASGSSAYACGSVAPSATAMTRTRTMTHPSGAVGRFTLSHTAHGRSFVECRWTAMGPNIVGFTSMALTRKAISGPGLPELAWTYTYPPAAGGVTPCVGCPSSKSVIVTDARGVRTRHVFGIRWRDNEGSLLQVDEGWDGSSALRSTVYRYRGAAAGPYLPEFGYSHNSRGDGFASARNEPMERRTTVQQGRNFVWEATSFDDHARPTEVVRSGPSGALTEATDYRDFNSPWVRGLTAQVRSLSQLDGAGNPLVIEANEYDSTTALRTRSLTYGLETGKWDYHADGTLWRAYDRAGRFTTFLDYKLGLPRSIVHPDQAAEAVTVDDLGLVTSHTNAAATTTRYCYDAMGRLARIVYPTGDPATYHDTTSEFVRSAEPYLDLGAGHWTLTVSTGAARSQTLYDALWRPRYTLTWDANNPQGSMSVITRRYEPGGKPAFESYPQRTAPGVGMAADGRHWHYDALGRVTLELQDSELTPRLLNTVTEYLDGFRKRVTNPRGHVTTFGYQAWDDPTENSITDIDAPEGVTVAIGRDALGKPLTITRSGGGVSATRRYTYDAYQRLCKTVEPESGATVQGYDAAGNVSWRASGQDFPGPGCETQVAGSSLVNFAYDARNRLLTTTYGDGSQNITRGYTADGLLSQISAIGGGNSIVWTYGYNNRRLLIKERYTWGDPNNGWNFEWGIEAHGHVRSLTDPWGTVQYAPDALGRPTQVSGYASAVSYHPNGAVAGYTLDNGIGHVTTQNARGLPELMQDGSVVRDRYAYDANGNVTAITDEAQAGANSRSMTLYDGLDRLVQASGPWGAGSFSYDALDNLNGSTVGGRSLTHHFDAATNRLTRLSGSLNLNIGYDPNGNIALRGSQGFAFDIGNRMKSATGKASYWYDGHGRRGLARFVGGDAMLQAYTQDGKLRFGWRQSQGAMRHVYLGDRLIAERTSSGVTSYVHTDGLGSPVAKTSGTKVVVSRTRYEPYGATVAGSSNPTTIGYTGHVNDVDTGLVYMQQRYYDPFAGRFLSVDPVTTDAGSGGHFNRYAYGDNNPYKYTDPDGRSPVHAGLKALDLAASATDIVSAFHSGGAVAGLRATLEAVVGPPGAKLVAKVANAVGDVAKAGKATGTLPKPGHGPGAVPKEDRDPKRLFTPAEREAKRAEQDNQCGNGCGTKIDETNSDGHHIKRHADGGQTVPENHAEVCKNCHRDLHKE